MGIFLRPARESGAHWILDDVEDHAALVVRIADDALEETVLPKTLAERLAKRYGGALANQLHTARELAPLVEPAYQQMHVVGHEDGGRNCEPPLAARAQN